MDEAANRWRSVFASIRTNWVLVVAAGVAVALVTAIATAMTPDEQRVTGRLVVGPSTELDADFGAADSMRVLTQAGVLGTLAEIIQNPGTLEEAVDALPEGTDAGAFTVTAEEVPGSTVIEVHVDAAPDQEAQAVAAQTIAGATTLFGELYPIYEVRVLDQPRVVGTTAGVPSLQLVAVGAVVGVVAAILFLLAWEQLVLSVRTAGQAVRDRLRLRRRPRPADPPAREADPVGRT